MTYQVTLPYMCAGVITDDSGMIREAAPILRWSVGKPINRLAGWVEGKGGTLVNVK